jgi:hypothetical protein
VIPAEAVEAADPLTISQFLLERIEEDEADVADHFCEPGFEVRLSAECAAKRAIIEQHRTSEVASLDRATWGKMFEVCNTCAVGVRQVVFPCPTLKALASVYKDHPDYLQEWAA